ncbi:MAG: hydrophobe/amphiphile efflux-1 family RND transporter, partial [Phycisphaerae bacterium]|nr:hydrophobe/amphiphile efflux-1 family RND transporter [Phycisphaerae bacterium]
YFMFRVVPTGFLPEEDQGYFITNIQGPEGSSLQRTEETVNQVYDILKNTPGVAHTISIMGLNFLTSASDSNSGAVFAVLEPWSERKGYKNSVFGIMERVREEYAKI